MKPRLARDVRWSWWVPLTRLGLLTQVARAWPWEHHQSDEQPLEGGDDHVVRTTASEISSCKGIEEQWASCRERACAECEPKDCIFSKWSEWVHLAECTGLGLRQRAVHQANNECGKPCNGLLSQTAELPKFAPSKSCTVKDQDCFFSSWSPWSECRECKACDKDTLGQSIRTRRVEVQASGYGSACTGDWNETKPCSWAEDPVDCKFTSWGDWTPCSVSCDGGVKERLRRYVLPGAQFGGEPCIGPLRIQVVCSTQACREPVDCEVSEWGHWSGCRGGTENNQQFRDRRIKKDSQGGGKPCDMPLRETVGCRKAKMTLCVYTEWSHWSTCSSRCGGGQRERHRKVAGLTGCQALEATALKEIDGCNEQDCGSSKPCVLSKWSEWTACSSPCDSGITTRERRVLQLSQSEAVCEAGLSEVKECSSGPCRVVDCKWGDWDVWGACTATCGGGLKRRSRIVVRSPRGGGQLCPAEDKSEVRPCGTQACDHCIDGRWTEWGSWSECTATCGTGYRWRSRGLDRRENHCGKPAFGLEEEYDLCHHNRDCEYDQDCILSPWGVWGSCSCTCFGVKERHRRIVQFSKAKGKPCKAEGLEERAPCLPGVHQAIPYGCKPHTPQDCTMSEWSPWGACTVTCGGGEHSRQRKMLTHQRNGGKPCAGSLEEMGPCSTQPCRDMNCVDCLWGPWSVWGSCSHCGGQRYRLRMVERLPNSCGRRCDARDSKETQQCHSSCEKELKAICRWSDWAVTGDCSASCGAATRMHRRQLLLEPVSADAFDNIHGEHVFFKGTVDAVCSGEQTRTFACPVRSCSGCSPVDCRFSPWGDWGDPDCEVELCLRYRSVDREHSCGGDQCSGPDVQTKTCNQGCAFRAADCELDPWSEWSHCEEKEMAQKRRTRMVHRMGRNGGKACGGSLIETAPCLRKEDMLITNCTFSSWGDWSSCSKLCDGGLHHRERTVTPATSVTAKACQGSLYSTAACNTQPCVEKKIIDCLFSAWNRWSECAPKTNQKHRTRSVAVEPADGGAPCVGELVEVRHCKTAVDCEMSPWSSWDECDKSCGGGQQQRSRMVAKNPRGFGEPCPLRLIETRGCNLHGCDRNTDCEASPWSEWGSCSVTCGDGEAVRTRKVLEPRRGDRGIGCLGALTEARGCSRDPCWCISCKWGEWSSWSRCSHHCGGGQRSRSRNVTRLPTVGCGSCEPLDPSFVEPCNTQACPEHNDMCIDAQWGDWMEWEACSTTCEGGIHKRIRHVRRKASPCGKRLVGLSREVKDCLVGVPCHPEQDCQWGSWSMWSDCTSTCGGVKRRDRKILLHGFGHGRACLGAGNETQSCAFSYSSGLENFERPELYLNLEQVAENNIGGKGPHKDQTPQLRFVGVASDELRILDLVVKSNGPYFPLKSFLNGPVADSRNLLANINLGSGSSTEFEFQFVDQKTGEPAVVEDLVLKFFDVDDLPDSRQEEVEFSVTVNTPCQEFFTSYPSRLEVEGRCFSSDPITFRKPTIIDPKCPKKRLPSELNLKNVVHINLANKGPHKGAPNMRYSQVGYIGGEAIDLILQVIPGSDYETSNPRANGHYEHFGIISQLPGATASFLARFVKKGSDVPIRVSKVNITFVDLDKPYFSFLNKLIVRGFKKFYFPGKNGKTSLLYRDLGGQGASFTSQQLSVPEPPSLFKMTEEQKEAAVTFYFEDIFQFSFDLEVIIIGEASENLLAMGQAFMFGGFMCDTPADLRFLSPGQAQPGATGALRATARAGAATGEWETPLGHETPNVDFKGDNWLRGRRLAETRESCPEGYYREFPILFHCHGGSGSIKVSMPSHTLAAVQDAPAGVLNLILTVKSEKAVDLNIWDMSHGRYIVSPRDGVLNNAQREGTYGEDLHVVYSGDDPTPPIMENCSLEGTLEQAIQVRLQNHAEAEAEATLEYAYDGLKRCPPQPVGCTKYDKASAKTAVLSWGEKMRSDFSNAEQAWQTFNKIARPRGIPWDDWIVVWDHAPTWKEAFEFLDTDDDGYISRHEFGKGYKLVDDEVTVMPTPAPSGPPSPAPTPEAARSNSTDQPPVDGMPTPAPSGPPSPSPPTPTPADNEPPTPAASGPPTPAPSGPPTQGPFQQRQQPTMGTQLGGAEPPYDPPKECKINGVPKISPRDIYPRGLPFVKERKAVAIRFKDVSSVRVRLEAKGGCAHNFAFAGKACPGGDCDTCPIRMSCKFMEWQEWSECSKSCGGGETSRNRDLLRVPIHSADSGTACDGAVLEARTCNPEPCGEKCEPVDCKWSKWSSWTDCDTCGGQKTRTRRIEQVSKCAGRPCQAGSNEETAKCPRDCKGDRHFCVWEDWSPFSNCSVTCGCGRKKRTRQLVATDKMPKEHQEHVPMLLAGSVKEYQELRLKVQASQSQRIQAIILAFAAGSVSLVLVLLASRAFGRACRRQDQVQARRSPSWTADTLLQGLQN